MFLLPLAFAVAYRFPVGQPVNYHALLRFDGYLPIMGIGEGKAEVKGTFQVVGKTSSSASAELTGFEVTFNGSKIPLDLDDAKKFVPGGTFTYEESGKVSAWDAPPVASPIRIPGLDLKHLPEVLVLPVTFPAAGLEVGVSFEFSLPLSGGLTSYTVTPATFVGDQIPISLKLHQTYAGFEDAANQVVDEKDAVSKVATDVVGTGKGVFDTKLGRFVSFSIDDVATTKATSVESKSVTTRMLTRHMEITS